MNKSLLPWLFLAFLPPVAAQIQPDGSFYTAAQRANMRHIADSLHEAFQAVHSQSVYWSKPQARAHFIFIDSLTDEAAAFLATNPSFNAFVRRFPFVKMEKNRLVLRGRRAQYFYNGEVNFETFPEKFPIDELELPADSTLLNDHLKDRCVFEVFKAHQYRPHDEIVACFFQTDIAPQPIPEKYGKMMQYVDFLLDTTVSVYKIDRNRPPRDSISLPAKKAFYNFVFPGGKGDFSGLDAVAGSNCTGKTIDPVLGKDPKFQTLLKAAVEEALKKKTGALFLEEMSARYLPPQATLKLKRLRNPDRGCGNDNAGRYQDLSIAQMAADVGDWQVFLHAHLYLFRSMFDGAFSKKARQLYPEAMESMGIQLPEFLLGAMLSCDKFPYGRFRSSPGATIEMAEYDRFENLLIEAIGDANLDLYNRYLCWEKLNSMRDSWVLTFPKASGARETEAAAWKERRQHIKKKLPPEMAILLKD